jgi:hypothetical protein
MNMLFHSEAKKSTVVLLLKHITIYGKVKNLTFILTLIV